MPRSGIRPRRVAELVKAELGRLLITEFQDQEAGLIAVTRVEMTADLLTARVYLSVFGGDPEAVLVRLRSAQRVIRKSLASSLNLKYNPELIFALDPGPGHQERIDQLIASARKRGPHSG